MDDSCAVCADALEWVAYGPCGHRDVCSTCVVRLRFVLDDRRCCICKTENPLVFVTKAMGDYTRVITDFLLFPSGATDGRVGEFWYHEDTQAYFDDVDHYRMIKAMCRLSCSVCDRSAEEQGTEAPKRRSRFKSIEQLKGHLFHQHRLFMCSLCLEGRKVFICEQKLYTRSQLTQHISTGNSEVDGSESERGGFMGHPMCEFCRNPFYGDNELYLHMSTEHYTCHICQRQHPGQYDYYKNYDDLETHFRQEHFLCEDEACLAKKFIVFQTDAEMKRHNAIEHGGHMSRSKRNAALQIPTSFRFRRSAEQERRRGRGRGFHADQSENQLAMAIQASLETAVPDSTARHSASGARLNSEHGETSQSEAVAGSFESLSINPSFEMPSRSSMTQSQSSRGVPVLEELSFSPLADREPVETSSRYAQALHSSANAADLRQESFPPLPGVKKGAKPKVKQQPGVGLNTMATRLNVHKKGSSSSINHVSGPSGSSCSSQIRPTPGHQGASTSATSQPWPAINQGGPSNSAGLSSSSSQIRPTPSHQGSSTSAISQPWPAISQGGLSSTGLPRENGFASTSSISPARNINVANRMKQSASAPDFTGSGFSKWPISTSRNQTSSVSTPSLPKIDDVHMANKSLVERICSSLGNDGDKFAAFKSISAEYRQNMIGTLEYLSYVEQFGLVHLVLELARLCPDANKQRELIEAYNASIREKNLLQNGETHPVESKNSLSKKAKGKGKGSAEGNSANEVLADSILSTVRKLQTEWKPQEGELEILTKDGYRAAKDKQPLHGFSSVNVQVPDSSSYDVSLRDSSSSAQKSDRAGGSKQRKKSSKFHRIRLGDGSAAMLLDFGRTYVMPEDADGEPSKDPGQGGLPIGGAWRNGGGLKLVADAKKTAK